MGMNEDGVLEDEESKINNILTSLSEEELMKIYLEVCKRLNAKIDEEIKRKRKDPSFMSSEYRRLRLEGYTEEQLSHQIDWIYAPR